jgi:capsid protein
MIIEQIATNGPKYKPYIPTRTEALIDGLVSVFSPKRGLDRAHNRERLAQWKYAAAKSNDVRPNSGPMSSGGDTMQGDRERRQILWNALELVENSGLASSIRDKMVTYICGSMRYQSRTGEKSINTEYEDYIRMRLGKGLDYAGNRTGRQLICTGLDGQLVKGDFGLNLVRDGQRLYVQGIEADRIGNPYEYKANDSYVGGVHIDPFSSAHNAYDIYRRTRGSGMYKFDVTVPARTPTLRLPNFLFSATRHSFDEVRGRSLFSSTLDNITYIERIREYELQAMVWASSQSGVFYTATGRLPGELPFHTSNIEVDRASGKQVTRFTAKPNQITALGMAERVEMFKNERPSPNVVAMYQNTIKDIALGSGLSYGFIYEMSGTGPAVRYYSGQDKRMLDRWKANLKEDMVSPLIIILLMEGIDNGDIPFHPRWINHDIIFPPHPTIDAGRESAADINENNALLKSGAEIVAEQAQDIEEVQEQCAQEVENSIRLAMDIAKRLKLDNWREVYGFLKSGKSIIMSPAFEAARAEQLDAAAQKSEDDAKRNEDMASSGGSELE